MVGSSRAERRVKLARGLLHEAGMGEERLAMVRRHDLSDEDIMRLAEERASAVGLLGPNPMRAAVGQPEAEVSAEARN